MITTTMPCLTEDLAYLLVSVVSSRLLCALADPQHNSVPSLYHCHNWDLAQARPLWFIPESHDYRKSFPCRKTTAGSSSPRKLWEFTALSQTPACLWGVPLCLPASTAAVSHRCAQASAASGCAPSKCGRLLVLGQWLHPRRCQSPCPGASSQTSPGSLGFR